MATEEEFWGRPFEPGPVMVDPNRAATRARIVREALIACAHDSATHATDCGPLLEASRCGDDVLAKLGRMLKHG